MAVWGLDDLGMDIDFADADPTSDAPKASGESFQKVQGIDNEIGGCLDRDYLKRLGLESF